MEMARKFRHPLMPWQEQVAMVGGELVEDEETGLLVPAYREVVFTTPRQSGKTSLVLAWECQRAIGWEEPQRIAYSAQTGADARKKLLLDQKPVVIPYKRALGINRFYESKGDEGIVWENGSRLVLLNNTEESGHGSTIDLAVRDELFADYDDRRADALGPAMITRPLAQVLSCSTAGTEESIPWNALVSLGRLAVDSGQRRDIAYFEWSAGEDDDPDDPATWWSCMPALGRTINEAAIRSEHTKKTANGFRRAYLNLKTKAEDRVIPARQWDAACSDTAEPNPPTTFALDINPERSAGSIVAATAAVVAVVDHRPGISWLVTRAAELDAKFAHPLWVVDSTSSSPASGLIPNLIAAGLRVHPATAHELIDACGRFFDAITEGSVSIRRHAALDDAAAGVAKRRIGDSFAWTRKNASADISPLVAATLALWGAGRPVENGPSQYEERGFTAL